MNVVDNTETIDENVIKAALNEKTAALLINSPNNPSGVVYSEETIIGVTDILKKKEKELN